MSIVVNLDVVLARKKIRSRQLAADMALRNPMYPCSNPAKCVAYALKHWQKSAVSLNASQAIFLNIAMRFVPRINATGD